MTLMDTAQLLGSLGDFVGAIVVAVTLIYLSVQVRQNTRALHAQTRQTALSSDETLLLTVVEHPDIILIQRQADVSALSPDENVKLGYWLVAVMRSRFFAWLQHRDGIIDEVQWNQETQVTTLILGGSHNRLWWQRVGRVAFPGEFVAFVDALLRDVAPTHDNTERVLSWSDVQQRASSG
jgi:hypothetical protein